MFFSYTKVLNIKELITINALILNKYITHNHLIVVHM